MKQPRKIILEFQTHETRRMVEMFAACVQSSQRVNFFFLLSILNPSDTHRPRRLP